MREKPYLIPSNIGGRYFDDITQIVYSVASRTKEVFSINSVPNEVVQALSLAMSTAKDLEKQLERIQELVGKEE